MIALDDRDVAALMQAFLLGVGQNPLPAPIAAALQGHTADPALAALALAAQYGRFQRPSVPLARRTIAMPEDARSIVPDALRPLLLRLFAGRGSETDDAAAVAVSDALARRGWRLHPFDLPRLEALLAAQPSLLGPSERAWLAHTAPNGRETPPVDGTSEDNWRDYPLAARIAFIRERRRHDADRAREMVATALPGEPANVRAGLIAALAEGFGPGDRELLESLAGDRAQSVRDAATDLLTRLPGTEAHAAHVKDLLSRITVRKTGLLSRRTVLALATPANIVDTMRQLDWAADQVRRAGIGPLAASLGLDEPAMAAASTADPMMAWGVLATAASERRLDLAVMVAESVEDPEGMMLAIVVETLDGLDGAERDRLLAAVFRPDAWRSIPEAAMLARLCRALRGSLPLREARAFLGSNAWRATLDAIGRETSRDSARQTAVAALVPQPLRGDLRRQLKDLPPAATARALLTMDALDLLDSGTPNSPQQPR